MSTDTLERPSATTEQQAQEPGDHDLFAHYVKKDAIMAAAVEGTPVVALCGKQWVPTRDGQKFPKCPECDDIFENVVGTKLPGNK